MDLSIAREESPAPATKKTLLKSKVFSFFAIHDLRVPEVRLRPPPVADTGRRRSPCEGNVTVGDKGCAVPGEGE